MSTLEIELPDDVRAAVDAQVSSGRYANYSAYVLALIAEDQRRLRQGAEQGAQAEPADELDDETHAQLLHANEQIERGAGYTVEQAREHFRRQMSGR